MGRNCKCYDLFSLFFFFIIFSHLFAVIDDEYNGLLLRFIRYICKEIVSLDIIVDDGRKLLLFTCVKIDWRYFCGNESQSLSDFIIMFRSRSRHWNPYSENHQSSEWASRYWKYQCERKSSVSERGLKLTTITGNFFYIKTKLNWKIYFNLFLFLEKFLNFLIYFFCPDIDIHSILFHTFMLSIWQEFTHYSQTFFKISNMINNTI